MKIKSNLPKIICDDTNFACAKEILPNGLTLVEIAQPHLHLVSISVNVKTGSRFEQLDQNGLSHFLEHMVFRGTEQHPSAFELNMAFENLGASVNGGTTPDSTEYTVTLPSQSASTGMDLLCQMVTTPTFSEIDTERKIIAEEILEDYDEHDNCIDIDSLSRARVWHNSGLGRSITGTLPGILDLNRKDLQTWFSRNYVAANMVVCVSGNIASEAFRHDTRRLLGTIPTGTRNVIPPPWQTSTPAPYMHVHKPGSQTQLRLAFRTAGLLAPEYCAVEIMLRMIDDGMSTPLHRTIFENRALAYNIGAELEAYEDTGVFNIDAQASHENIIAIVKESLKIVHRIKSGAFDDGELVKAKNRAAWDLESLNDYPGALNAWYGEQELYRKAIHPLEAGRLITQLKKKNITAIAQQVFQQHACFITTVGQQSLEQQRALEKFAFSK